MVSRENLLRLLTNNRRNKVTKTKKLNRDKRWIFENNRGLLFIYNMNNRKRPIRNSNIAYRNNGKRIVPVRSNYYYGSSATYVPAKSGGYRVPPRRRRVVRRY